MGFNEVNPEVKKKVKNLTVNYKDVPQPELLIGIPNPHPDVDYKIVLASPEVTSLCPLNPGQPDYVTITIEYWPAQVIIELKSLKLYLVSYRNVEIFHESIVGHVLKDLVRVCQPKKMTVTGDFTVRGGIHTVIEANYQKPEA